MEEFATSIQTTNAKASLYRHMGFQVAEIPRFLDIKMVWFSVLRTGLVYHQENIPSTYLFQRLNRQLCHSAIGRYTSMKNSNDINGSRT